MKLKINKANISSIPSYATCTYSKIEFTKCVCNQCKEFVILFSEWALLPRDVRKYIYFERP